VLNSGIDSYIVEQQVRCEDGSYKWLLTRGMVEGRGKDGAPLRMVGTSSDITDRKDADERQIRAVLEAAPDGMLLVAGDGVIRFANDVAARLFAYPQQELIGQSVDILVPAAVRGGHHQKRNSFAEHPVSRPMAANSGLQAVRRNQETFPVEISLSPFVLNAERLVIVSVTDISARVTAERALAAAHRHTELILNSVGEGIYGVDVEGSITFVNPHAIQLFGYEQHEMIGRPSHGLFHHTRINGDVYPAHECKIHDSLQTGVPHRVSDEVFWRKDGSSFPVEYVSAPIRQDGKSVGAVVSFRDITERKTAENALRDLNETLEQRVAKRTGDLAEALDHAELAKRSRGEFLANMSHEIRTPMNAVLGMVYLALRTDPAAKQRDYLEKIQQSGQHLLGIINDILDFSKIDAGKMDLENGDFDLDSVISNITQLTEGKAREKGLHIAVDVAPIIPRRLRGDALRLGQILINFVNNAVKFTHEGGVVVRVGWSDESMAHADGDVVLRFEVEDSGIGLSLEQQSRLFKSFEQADNSTTRKYGGTGLGLAISKQLVQLMDGEVGVVSAPGRGSTFWFTARLQIASSLSDVPAKDEAQISLEALRGTNILVVDDNAFNLEVAKGILEDIGIQVVLAADGAEAVAMLRESRFDCVLMDVHMPVMNGLDATRTIRADPALAGTCVIAMTANARREDRDECLEAGMDDVLTKPINPEHLFATLAKWLRAPADEAVQQPKDSAAETLASEPVMTDVNVDVLRKLAKNNPEKMRMFVKLFLDGADRGMSDIDAALVDGNSEVLIHIGHRVKSSARSIGAGGFGELCQTLEELGLAADVASAAVLRNTLHETLNRIRMQLAQELE
jgi:PAS domain S-box-containing protein